MPDPALPSESPTKGERTRADLIDAAYALFATQGYHGTSLRQIAERAGLKAVGGVYNHFPGKEDLFVAVLTTYHPINQVGPSLADAAGTTVADLLHHALDLIYAYLEKHGSRAFLSLVFMELVEFEGKHADAIFASLTPEIMSFVQRIMAHSAEFTNPNPLVAVRTFFTFVFGLILAESVATHLPGNMILHAGNAHDSLDLLLHGMLNPPQGDRHG